MMMMLTMLVMMIMVMNQLIRRVANDDDCDDNKNVCRAACVHKNQSNCDKFSKLITNCSEAANPGKSRKTSKRSRDESIWLIPSRKIPGSRDFAKIPSRKSRD